MTSRTETKMPDLCSRRHPYHFSTALNILIKLGVDINEIDILAVGEYENYKGEVVSQNPKPGVLIDTETRISLEIGFPSAVDFMPYQFFYGLAGGTSRSSAWESRSRALMAPFDSSLIKYTAIAKEQALRLSLANLDVEHLSDYLKLFHFEPRNGKRPTAEVLMWASLMPSFNFWAGNPELVARVLKYVFGYKFRIVENVEGRFDIPADCQSRLGQESSQLGKQFVMGREFREFDTTYELHISDVSPDEVRELLPGQSVRRRLEWLLGICMPNAMDCRISIKVNRDGMMLGSKKHKRYLGYATHLSNG